MIRLLSEGDCQLHLICPDGPNAPCNTHHLWWEKNKYRTELEKEFRDLPCNKIQTCFSGHKELHATTKAPKKPSRDFMEATIDKHNNQKCWCYPSVPTNTNVHTHSP